ncbi:histidine phosphatase family protein [Novosphingobium sp.]|uniref:histidine phosphatase family protein n=1 Tax=Novosphingobium sp. TaxID=1874826 RepID=UPI003D146AC9
MKRYFIMRHGETIYNLHRVLQSNTIHTPLTRLGCDQATRMGTALLAELGRAPPAHVHVSDTGRALQTLSLICEATGLDWFTAQRSADLREIEMGSWCLRSYADVEAEVGPVMLADHLLAPAPDGEDYPAIAARLTQWLAGAGSLPGDHVVVMHGISSRVLRGILTGQPDHPAVGAPVGPSLVQGSIALIVNGTETVLFGSPNGTQHA